MPTKKFLVKLKLHSVEGLSRLMAGKSGELGTPSSSSSSTVMLNVKWKGPRGALGSRFKRSLKRAKTTEKIPEDGPIVTWEEEFEHACTLTVAKDGHFLPWDVYFVITQVGVKSRLAVLGTAVMNLAKFVSTTENIKQATKVPVLTSGGVECQAALIVSANFVEMRTPESMGFDRAILPCISGPLVCNGDEQQLVDVDAEERSKTMKSLTSDNSKRTTRQLDPDVGESSPKSDQVSDSSRNSFDSDTTDDWDEEEAIDVEEYCIHSYGSLAGVNLVVEGALSRCKENKHAEDHVPSTCKRGALTKGGEQMATSDSDQGAMQSSILDQGATPSSVRSILAWRKRNLSFRSPRRRGEPLLNKAYGENGGDDIDFDRRLSGSPISPSSPESLGNDNDASSSNLSGCLDFGDEHFAVGSWERQELFSRDGQMKLSADVFFATIDQRSERAAGESACTALVAVIADWLHQNPGRMPIKAELDTLIREGSAEWRKLCDNGKYRERFPDRHFDLDTVLHAKVRPLVDLPEKSYVGFFQPKGMGDCCDFLQGAMSFDSIWEEIISVKLNGCFEPAVYIVSWNDHFFILKVEKEVCYIIDTLGERLYEGCNQAYILCFDKDAGLSHVPRLEGEERVSCDSSASSNDTATCTSASLLQDTGAAEQSPECSCSTDHQHETDQGAFCQQSVDNGTVYRGKEACKEFIKGFFAALPLRELEIDIKKGLLGSIPLHQRLQIEFHFTSLVFGPSLSESE